MPLGKKCEKVICLLSVSLFIACTFQMANLEERLERLENAIGQNVEKVVSALFLVRAKVGAQFALPMALFIKGTTTDLDYGVI